MAEITVGPGSGTGEPHEPGVTPMREDTDHLVGDGAAPEPGGAGVPGPGTVPAVPAGLPADLVADLGSTDPVVAVRGLVHLARWSDAQVIATVRAMAVTASSTLLTRAGETDAGELSPDRRARWRTEVKSAVACELAAATGWGISDCHDRVALALAPPQVADPAVTAMAGGWNDWRQVRTWWEAARRLDPDTAADIADVVFGPIPDGAGVAVAPSWNQFRETLGREVTRAEGTDAAAARQRRTDRLAARDVSTTADADGTATLTVTGSLTSVVGASERIETIARRARAAGDARTLGQLRADLTLALLIHGTIPPHLLPPDTTDTTTTETTETSETTEPHQARDSGAAATAGVSGGNGEAPGDAGTAATEPGEAAGRTAPTGPDQAAGAPGHATDGDGDGDGAGAGAAGAGDATPASAAGASDPAVASDAASAGGATHPAGDGVDDGADDARGPVDAAPAAPPGQPCCDLVEVGSVAAAVLAGVGPVALQVVIPFDVLFDPGSTSVVQVPGYGHLSAEAARDLITAAALVPGSTLHRVVTDPATGRVVELTTPGYRPDQALIDQVRALDRTCLGPGCTAPAHRAQLDHQTPWGTPGAATTTSELSPEHGWHHHVKTKKWWTTTFDATRTMTWTTLFGAIYTTTAPDLRNLLNPRARGAQPATGAVGPGAPPRTPPPGADPADPDPGELDSDVLDADLRDQLLYAALAHRDPTEDLSGPEDSPDLYQVDPGFLHPATLRAPTGLTSTPRLRHTTPGGAPRRGPPPQHPTPDQIWAHTTGHDPPTDPEPETGPTPPQSPAEPAGPPDKHDPPPF